MTTLTKEARNALLSARAKNRKAAIAVGEAGLQGASVPKHIVTKMTALNEWFDSQLTVQPKAEAKPEAAEAVAEAA